MALSYIGSAKNYSDSDYGTTMDCTSTLNVQAGDILIVGCVWRDTDCTVTVADTGGNNSMTMLARGTDTGTYVRTGYRLVAQANSTATFRMTCSTGVGYKGIFVQQFRPDAGDFIEFDNGPNNATGNNTTPQSANFSTTLAKEIAFFCQTSYADSPTFSNAWINETDSNGNYQDGSLVGACAMSRILSATFSSQHGQVTSDNYTGWTAQALCIKVTPADVVDTSSIPGSTILRYTATGTRTVYIPPSWITDTVAYLVVAGGGAGGADRYGAGGGAGGLKTATGFTPASAGVTVTVGAGGVGQSASYGTDGGASVFDSISTTGGGGGVKTGNGRAGGSGGGAASGDDTNYTGGAKTGSEGYAGGNASYYGGGGGGGYSAVGANRTNLVDGDGGAGYNATNFGISANSGYVAGGGGGAVGSGALGPASGAAGGGAGGKYDTTTVGTAAAANSGSGGGGYGGGTTGTGLAGGSGIVCVRYPSTLIIHLSVSVADCCVQQTQIGG